MPGCVYFIGLGLGDERDITVKGLEVVKRCARVYLEAYTAILGVDRSKLEAFYGREVIEADRELVEQAAEEILNTGADNDQEIAFLVVGDPFGATTHTDLYMRAVEKGVRCQVIHNTSIMNAIGICGLQLYNFGQTVSICFFTETWRPDSFYSKVLVSARTLTFTLTRLLARIICSLSLLTHLQHIHTLQVNVKAGFHTMCLLDIKVKEQSHANMAKGLKIYEPPRFMSVNQCLQQLLEVEAEKKEGAYGPESPCFGVARIGHEDQVIKSGTMQELLSVDFGAPLHTVGFSSFVQFLAYLCLRLPRLILPFTLSFTLLGGAGRGDA
jgi:diphthine synthase